MANLSDITTHTRASSATYVDANGILQTAAINEPRVGHHIYNGSAWVDAGYFHESEARTNLILGSEIVEQKDVYVTPQAYTLSFQSGQQLRSEISETLAVTAVDVFVYDTTKDSDGGAWRTGALAQASSWYNETLNTAIRGSRQEFPQVAVIVAEATKVTIYDGDDPSLPMWMVFDVGPNKSISFGATTTPASVPSSIVMLNGIMFVGVNTGSNPYSGYINFLAEENLQYGTKTYRLLRTIANRNVTAAFLELPAATFLVNKTVNDVAMTVLPDAPIDPATGLPVPTIAVATAGGVSVITDSGAVYDLTYTLGNVISSMVAFYGMGGIFWGGYSAFAGASIYLYWNNTLPTADDATAPDAFYASNENPAADLVTKQGNFGYYRISVSDIIAASASNGLFLIDQKDDSPADGMTLQMTSSFNTGWMNGDIKGAFLSDTDDTDLVGGTDADRSVNGNALTVNGTVTRTPVATGADLVAYSGFSSANYLEQPYNSALDFGTGDFCVMGWVNLASTGYGALVHRSAEKTSTGNAGFCVFYFPTGIGFKIGAQTCQTTTYRPMGLTHVCAKRDGTVGTLYINGQLVATNTGMTNSATVANATLLVGGYWQTGIPVVASSNDKFSLLRISATAPSAEQIAKIYNDEKVLFQENAQATLYGSSDAVTALAHDLDTNLLHVGTSAGRSVFDGLRRIDNTTNAVTTAISASGGFILEQ